MANFFYKCRFNDHIIQGSIAAIDIADASKKLSAKNYVVLEIKQVATSSSSTVLKVESTPFNIKEKKDFYTSLAKQYKSGISFLEIFNNIITSGSSENVKGLAFKIMRKIQKGDSVSEVFSYFSPYIGKTQAALIIAGDASGNLESVLEKISQQVKEEENIIANIKSKITYPLILIGLLFLVLQIVFFFIFPIFNQFSQSEDIVIKSMVISALIKIAICTSIVAILVFCLLKTKTLFETLMNNLCKTKLIKQILENYYFSNFFMTLALAQEAGLSPCDAIQLSKDTILDKNIAYKLSEMQNMLQNGCKISTAFAVSCVFSEYALSQIDTGEASGSLEAVYNDIAQDYKNNFNQKVDFVTKAVEPAMIAVISVIVLFVCLKLVTKYYEALFSAF